MADFKKCQLRTSSMALTRSGLRTGLDLVPCDHCARFRDQCAAAGGAPFRCDRWQYRAADLDELSSDCDG